MLLILFYLSLIRYSAWLHFCCTSSPRCFNWTTHQ